MRENQKDGGSGKRSLETRRRRKGKEGGGERGGGQQSKTDKLCQGQRGRGRWGGRREGRTDEGRERGGKGGVERVVKGRLTEYFEG